MTQPPELTPESFIETMISLGLKFNGSSSDFVKAHFPGHTESDFHRVKNEIRRDPGLYGYDIPPSVRGKGGWEIEPEKATISEKLSSIESKLDKMIRLLTD
jgi:hypothetical protein